MIGNHHAIRAGFNRYNYDNTETQTDPSYSVSLSHVLTERLSHSLTLGRDTDAPLPLPLPHGSGFASMLSATHCSIRIDHTNQRAT